MSVRIATETDLPAIHSLVRELAVFEKAEKEFIATLETYERDFAAGWFKAIVKEVEGEIIGMALFYPTYSTWKGRMLYLEDFVVKEAFRRKGYGQQLFEGVLDYAKQAGCTLLKWQVLDWNEPALAFYHKNKSIIETEWWTGKIIFQEKPK